MQTFSFNSIELDEQTCVHMANFHPTSLSTMHQIKNKI